MKILLVDGNSFCYRAFYAIRDLRNAKGEPTNAVYGFVTMLQKLIEAVRPDGLAVAFDVKGPTFRHKRYEEYKIQRKPMPEDLVVQMPVIKEVVKAMNVPIYEKEGYEADDVMATLAKKIEKEGCQIFIVTADKDALQLVNEKIKVLNPQKDNQVYDKAAVKLRYGITPDQVVDMMALMGDASDNIPGVPGVGEKTAVKLIGEFGSLKRVYEKIDRLPNGKVKDNLVQYKDQAWLSRELATIDSSVPLEVFIDDLKRKPQKSEALAELYRSLDFKSLLKALPGQVNQNSRDTELKYHLILEGKAFIQLKNRLKQEQSWAFDFETTGTDALKARPIGISFSFKEKEAFYVSFRDEEETKSDLFDSREPAKKKEIKDGSVLSARECLLSLKEIFENETIKKIGQNIKYEMMVLHQFGIKLSGIFFDTMVASYCLNPSKPNHNLDDIAMEHLGVRITPIQELIGSGSKQITMDQVELDRVYRYGCQDSDITFRLSKILTEKLLREKLMDLFERLEMPLVSVLAEMEIAGVAISHKVLKELSGEMEEVLEKLTRQIHKEAGEEFNIQSPKQLAEILFEKLGLPVVKRTKTGASTDVEVLKELAEVHSLPKAILKFREISKLKSTYVDTLPLLADSKNHRVHTSFNQTVTATGRLSSSDPNLQNIPVRTEEGRKIRRAFVPGSRDSVIVSADYSQIELRVLAHLSQDEHLIDAFNNRADIHRYTASLIFNVKLAETTESMRDSAKTVNFGILYGMGAFSLSKSLGITMDAARDFIKAYFERYPRVKAYLDQTLDQARRDGFVSTYFKRRRYIPDILSKDPRIRSFAERTAINAPIQGTASDIIKAAMIDIAHTLKAERYKTIMTVQVHDELVFEVPKKELESLVCMVTDKMQGAVQFSVPLQVSVKVGPNWLDTEDWKG